jgi:hypothetical protein
LRIGKTWASVTTPYYPRLGITTGSGQVTVAWPAKDTPYDPVGAIYRGYQLQSAPALSGWTNDTTALAPDGTGTNWTATETLNAPQYFRLVEPPR